MPHIVIATVLIGSALTVGGALVLIFHRWLLHRVPERVSNWSYSRYVQKTPLAVIVFVVIVLVVQLLILLLGGLLLF
jgi:hypothetical protein